MTVIGLGEAGCNIAEKFERCNIYNVKLIDTEIEGDNCFSILKQKSPEDYESKFPDISSFLADCHDDILFFVGGGGYISGASLKVLSYLKNKNIWVFYIRPDTELLGSVAKMQDRLVFNVLQEYTRSGMFSGITLISNQNIEAVVGDAPLIGYMDKLNEVIVHAIDTVSRSTEKISIADNYSPPKKTSCICTYGVYDFENDNEKLFYDLSNIDDKCYYFFITKNRLDTDGQLFKKIKNLMKNKVVDKTKISYIIHSTDSEKDFCYVSAFSSKIQN